MASRPLKVRVGFLIALTLALTSFTVARLFRTYRREQVRTDFEQTDRELFGYAAEILRADQAELEDLALMQGGRFRSDAAALQVQMRYLIEHSRRGGIDVRDGISPDALADIKAHFQKLKDGRPLTFPKGKPFLRAYYAWPDGATKPYGICLPKSYDARRRYPVVVTLHGLQGFVPWQCRDAPYFEGAISVKPEGRRASDYMYIGEDDVLAVLEQVGALYSIDRSRVYLVGRSMGATGCWNLAAHYPHLFAGIAPIGGNADHSAWEQRWEWNRPGPSERQELREFLHSAFSPSLYAENLEHCRIVALHGTGDTVVPVEHSRLMVQRLREVNHKMLEYLEFPAAGHTNFPAWTREYALAKIFGSPPAGIPSRFRFKTAHPRHDRAWWLQIDRLGDPLRFSTVSANVADGAAHIETDNVSALTVLLNEMPPAADSILVDGQKVPLPEAERASRIALEKRDARWHPARRTGLFKRKHLSGPISDVFRDLFIVVYGTRGDSALRKHISRLEAMRFSWEWRLRYGDPPRVKGDKELTKRDTRYFNLVLFGGPEVNEVAHELFGGLPARIDSKGVTLGSNRYEGEDVGLLLCCPNPQNPSRMVVVIAGVTPAALYQAWDRFGLWFNWGIYDKYKWFDYAVFDSKTVGPESFLTVGFFDNQWRLSGTADPAGGGAAWTVDPAAASALLPQGFPALESAANLPEPKVPLSDVRPIAIRQYRGAVGFDRSYAGGPIALGKRTFEKGLGVKAPSTVTFGLDGVFSRFTATVGLTDGFKTSLSRTRIATEEVVFEVWGDGELLAVSPPLNWRPDGQTWTGIRADVSRVDLLQLKVRPTSSRTWLYGACAWADPVVSR